MNSTVKTIFIILISGGVFTLLLNLLKKNNPEIFYFIKKIPEPWKGKWFIRWIVLLILMLIIALLVVIVGLNDTIGTIIIGFFIALTDLIRRNKRGLGIKESDVFSIRLFYPETSCVIIWFCNHEIKKAETSPTKV